MKVEMHKYDKYNAKWKANMAKCSKYHAKCKVTMPKCSKYHAKRQVLVPNCCKYKANVTRKESQKKVQNLRQKKNKNYSTPLFGGSLARKLRFHIFNFQILREISQESFVFTSFTFTCSGKSRTKASFSYLQLSDFEGSLARKHRFHIFHFQILREVSHESCVFTSSTFTF